ncbi:MAG: DNA mismatch repair protein MutT, partial [Chitinophagaceae bacterium]|nr:DNA mismatch repair protein MutT [Chitinophagaceae bacterium]
IASNWTELFRMHLSNSVSDEFGITYLARALQQEKAQPEETENLVIKKIPFAEAFAMVERGEITDSMSVAAIYKVQYMLAIGTLK